MAPMLSRQQAGASASHLTNRLHFGYLDGLRALAAVYVVLHHGFEYLWLSREDTSPLWARWLSYGHLSVDLFIVISGFCLMLPVVRGDGTLRGGSLLFLQRRAQRILPPYYAALLLSLLLTGTLIGHLTGTLWDVSLPVTLRGVVIHLLLLHNFSVGEIFKINYPFWSISLEWWIYFLFPALVPAWKRFGPWRTTVAAIFVSYVLVYGCYHWFHQPFTLQYIALFALGMLGAEVAGTRRSGLARLRDRLPWGLLTGVLAGLSLLAVNYKVPQFQQIERSDFLVGLGAMALLVTLARHPQSVVCRAVSLRPFVFCGTFAYSIYLIHAPLLQLLWQYALHPLHLAPIPTFLLLEIIGIPAIIGLAYLFHLAFERPFLSNPGVQIKTEAQAEAAAAINPAP